MTWRATARQTKTNKKNVTGSCSNMKPCFTTKCLTYITLDFPHQKSNMLLHHHWCNWQHTLCPIFEAKAMVVESRRKQRSLKRRREAHESRKKGVIAVLWAAYYQRQINVLAAAMILFSCDRRSPKRHRDEHRAFSLSTLTWGVDECISELRL